jgi:hypothetical protein
MRQAHPLSEYFLFVLLVLLRLQGLLEMVSSKVAEWIAEFVEDVVRLNPALLLSPGSSQSPSAGPGSSVLRSPRRSPRPSRNNLNASGTPAAAAASTEGGAALSSSGGSSSDCSAGGWKISMLSEQLSDRGYQNAVSCQQQADVAGSAHASAVGAAVAAGAAAADDPSACQSPSGGNLLNGLGSSSIAFKCSAVGVSSAGLPPLPTSHVTEPNSGVKDASASAAVTVPAGSSTVSEEVVDTCPASGSADAVSASSGSTESQAMSVSNSPGKSNAQLRR